MVISFFTGSYNHLHKVYYALYLGAPALELRGNKDIVWLTEAAQG
jgi:hypothetical protein